MTTHKYYIEHKEEILAYGRKWTDANRAHVNAKQREWHRKNNAKSRALGRAAHKRMIPKLRAEVFFHYGGAFCACCGETEILFLTLDHKNNDGAAHRKRVMGASYGYGGWKFYMKLRKNNYPPLPLQVLCYNCNCGKFRNGGVCPHQSQKMTSPNGG